MKIKVYFIQVTLLFALISTNIFGQSLPTPVLSTPTNNSTNNSPNELLDWFASSGQTAYQYRYGLTSNLSGAPVFSVAASQASTINLNF
jgi:hypothetical protein